MRPEFKRMCDAAVDALGRAEVATVYTSGRLVKGEALAGIERIIVNPSGAEALVTGAPRAKRLGSLLITQGCPFTVIPKDGDYWFKSGEGHSVQFTLCMFRHLDYHSRRVEAVK